MSILSASIVQGIEMTSTGLGSFLLSSLTSGFANRSKRDHEFKLKALAAASQHYEERIADTQDARKYNFSFARRVILISVFVLPISFILLSAFNHIEIAVPVTEAHSYLFGLLSTTVTTIVNVKGFYLMKDLIMNTAPLLTGFYFGCKFKD